MALLWHDVARPLFCYVQGLDRVYFFYLLLITRSGIFKLLLACHTNTATRWTAGKQTASVFTSTFKRKFGVLSLCGRNRDNSDSRDTLRHEISTPIGVFDVFMFSYTTRPRTTGRQRDAIFRWRSDHRRRECMRADRYHRLAAADCTKSSKNGSLRFFFEIFGGVLAPHQTREMNPAVKM